MKILACSDVLFWNDFKKVCDKEKADFVFFLGDLVNDGHACLTKGLALKQHINEFYNSLKYASKKTKGVFVIEGNWDLEGYDKEKINKIKNCKEISGESIKIGDIKVLGLNYNQCHNTKNLQKKLLKNPDIDLIVSHSEKKSWNYLLSSNAKLIINGHFKQISLQRTNNKIIMSLGCFPDYLTMEIDKKVKVVYHEAEIKRTKTIRGVKWAIKVPKTRLWKENKILDEELSKNQTDFEEITWGNWFVMLNKKSDVKFSESKGKYLFFSKNKESLIELAKKLLLKYNLPQAKVPSNKSLVKDFVLCVYDKEPRFKQEMRQYADEKLIKYRYWKSDEDTLKGKYSDKFKQELSPENKKIFGIKKFISKNKNLKTFKS